MDYAAFAANLSGDGGARLRLVELPECALSTPQAPACRQRDLGSVNDLATRTLTATVTASGGAGAASAAATPQGTLVALATSPSSGGGDYSATGPKASATWSAGGESGDFAWTYPMRTPPGLNGPTPKVELSYSSQSSDGRTAASDNQPSWVGEGFDYEPGSISRSYKGCTDDGQTGV